MPMKDVSVQGLHVPHEAYSRYRPARHDRYPATHQPGIGLRTLAPEVLAVWDIAWSIRNPNNVSIQVGIEFELRRGGAGGLPGSVSVGFVSPFTGPISGQTLPGGEVIYADASPVTLPANGTLVVPANISVLNWLEDAYGLDASIMWRDPADNVWKVLGATFHQWLIPWVTLARGAPGAVMAPESAGNPAISFTSI